jgi:hypothetical protein
VLWLVLDHEHERKNKNCDNDALVEDVFSDLSSDGVKLTDVWVGMRLEHDGREGESDDAAYRDCEGADGDAHGSLVVAKPYIRKLGRSADLKSLGKP